MSNPLDDNPDKYTKKDVEQSKGRIAQDKAMKVIEANPDTVTRRHEYPDEVTVEIESIVSPHEKDQTLARLGYSKVEVGSVLNYTPEGDVIYPLVSTVMTYDLEGGEKEVFLLTEVAAGEVELGMEDEENTLYAGIDTETGDLSFDPTRFDPDLPDKEMPTNRPLTPQEELSLTSVLDVCETTIRNRES